ncbi:carboxypeptidase-like regulatory domain-containing protein [Sphingobacterium sp. LRF_L2]|uniref:carboxypeptidase-like regulatory domain-containing protein n=1 Tax=Sphingobacterium sp. LRF_L2 TaxID=3369421 RepID=UPI003F60EAAB
MGIKHFDITYIRKYVNGELSSSEMYEIERAAHEDEMLMDLIQGLEIEKESRGTFPKQDLQEALLKRTTKDSRRTISLLQKFSIAASILIISGIVWFFAQQYLPSKMDNQHANVANDSIQKEHPHTTTDLNIDTSTSKEKDHAVDSRLATLPPNKANGVSKNNKLRKRDSEAIQQSIPRLDSIASQQVASTEKIMPPIFADSVDGTKVAFIPQKPTEKSSSSSPQIRIRGVSTVTNKSTNTAVVFGKVIDDETNEALQNVQLRDRKTGKTFHTDSSGNFVAYSDSSKVNLDISYIGYETQNLIASTSEQKIRLRQDNATLEEVVVAGYKRSKLPKASEPAEGWKAFNHYVEIQTKAITLGKGTVTLLFDLDENNHPYNIRVKKTTNTMLNNKAIEILHNGPTWKRGSKSSDIVLKIVFDN